MHFIKIKTIDGKSVFINISAIVEFYANDDGTTTLWMADRIVCAEENIVKQLTSIIGAHSGSISRIGE